MAKERNCRKKNEERRKKEKVKIGAKGIQFPLFDLSSWLSDLYATRDFKQELCGDC